MADDREAEQRGGSEPPEAAADSAVPAELYPAVFKHLDLRDLASCCQTCKLWRNQGADLMQAWREEVLSSKFGFSMD
eukprot:jgi/Tetstr1/440234/TSEL_028585.t1